VEEAPVPESRRDTTPPPVPPDAALTAAVAALAERVTVLERRLGITAAPAAAGVTTDRATSGSVDTVAARAPAGADPLLPAIGSAVLMLAGAFLLRSVTDAGMLPAGPGIALGMGYAATLLLLTHRAAARGPRIRAQVFGAAALMVAYPFVWESATRLGLMPAGVAAPVTLVLTALAFAVTLRHRLRALSWAVLVATLVTLSHFYWTAGAPELFLLLIIALGATTVWFAYRGDWGGPRWLVAPVANLLTLATVTLAVQPAPRTVSRPEPDAAVVLPLAIGLPVAYLGSFAWRTLRQRREAGPFEIVQALGCLLTGYVGAIYLLRKGEHGLAGLGWATVVVALAAYVAAFTLIRRQQGRGMNFFYYAWLGLLLTMIGTAQVVPGQVLAYLWCGLALVTATAGGLRDRWTLRLHGAAYLGAAAILVGMHATVYDAFVAPVTAGRPAMSGPGLVVWIAAIAGYVLLAVVQHGTAHRGWRLLPRFLVALLVLLGLGSLAVSTLVSALDGGVFGSQAACQAVVRTAVLATTTVLLAVLASRARLRELGWFVGPLLVLTGLKLLLEDLARGTPVSLFASFTFFGVALIAAPRLRRRAGDAVNGAQM